MVDYFFHRFNKNNFHLTMTILVKNEVDVIEANIRTHAKLGVDSFVIMDHSSDDGTRELLEKLKDEFEITIIDETGLYQQKKFMTRLAFEAKKRYKPDWIINNDADEFWIPNNAESIKASIAFKGGILRVNRSNMLPSASSLKDRYAYFDAIFQVKNYINYQSSYNEDTSVILGVTSRKVMVNPHGLLKINTGNHSAEHIAIWNKKVSSDIHIYHYPVRSYEQFKKRIKSRMTAIKEGAKIGNHEKRWDKIYRDGKLEDEFKKIICFNECETDLLQKIGVLIKNELPSNTIIKDNQLRYRDFIDGKN